MYSKEEFIFSRRIL